MPGLASYVRIGRAGLLAAFGRDELALVDDDKAISLEPEVVSWREWRATFFVDRGRWQEAADDFQKAITPDPQYRESYNPLYHALLRAWLGDKPAYRQACLDFLEKFSGESDPAYWKHFTAWTCVLLPDAVTDYAPALAFARVSVERDPQNPDFLFCLGAVRMRAGEYERALISLDQAAGSEETAINAYFQAMTEQHLARKEDARQSLARANELAKNRLSDEAKPPVWNYKLMLELLRNEAEALIGKPQASPDADSPDPPPAPARSPL